MAMRDSASEMILRGFIVVKMLTVNQYFPQTYANIPKG